MYININVYYQIGLSLSYNLVDISLYDHLISLSRKFHYSWIFANNPNLMIFLLVLRVHHLLQQSQYYIVRLPNIRRKSFGHEFYKPSPKLLWEIQH